MTEQIDGVVVKEQDKEQQLSAQRRVRLYTFAGMLLGVMAPIGWIFVHLLLFWKTGESLVDQVVDDIVRTPQQVALYLYMCLGTAGVLGFFGFFIGRSTQQIHNRARKLDQLNHEIDEQKAVFERRFRDLDGSIKNFHTINTDLQKSVNRDEVIQLAANGLHEVIGFDRVNILMVDEARTKMSFAVSRGVKVEAGQDSLTLPMDDRAGCIFKAVRDRQVILVEDLRNMPEDYRLQPPFDTIPQIRSRSFILCPIVVRDVAVGLLAVDNKYKHRPLDDTDADTVKLFADQVSASLTKINLLEMMGALTRQLDQTFSDFLRYREEHAGLVHSLSDAIRATSDATADISGGSGVIQEAVGETLSSIGQISVSIDQVSGSLARLNDFIEKSVSSMTEIHYTVNAVEESGERSYTMSETVKNKAGEGVNAVTRVLDGMQSIESSVGQAETTISQLSGKSEEIGNITSVITDITQKTSLLALNAAIIASQAGEHGRSFAVVADEIRALAQESATSTEEINRIIEEIQAFIKTTVDHIGSTRQMVDDSVQQGRVMSDSLQQIYDSSVSAMEMSNDIRKSNEEISGAIDSVARSIEELNEMSGQVSRASQEESQGAKSIVVAVENVKAMTEDMVSATKQQVDSTQKIDMAVQRVADLATRIFDEMDVRREGSREVLDDLQRVQRGES